MNYIQLVEGVYTTPLVFKQLNYYTESNFTFCGTAILSQQLHSPQSNRLTKSTIWRHSVKHQ